MNDQQAELSDVEKNREKTREQQRKWKAANREHILASKRKYQEKYRRENRDQIAESDRRYREQNKEKRAEYMRGWGARNKDKMRAGCQRRRARKSKLEYTLTEVEWQKILDDHFHRCHYCGCKPESLEQDHKVPLTDGGGYTANNIVPSCRSCNRSKGVSNYEEFVGKLEGRMQLTLGFLGGGGRG